MPPESIDADPTKLLRSFRGYDREATEALFKRVAWDYGVLAGEHRKLKKTMDELAQPAASTPARAERDEDALTLLKAAHRAAREMRAAAREDCESALKKAKGRAAEIEAEAARAATNAVAVLQAVSLLRANLRAVLDRLESGEPLPRPTPTADLFPAAGSETESDSIGAAKDSLGLHHR
jgi:cell division septum initiation protein DivIVA